MGSFLGKRLNSIFAKGVFKLEKMALKLEKSASVKLFYYLDGESTLGPFDLKVLRSKISATSWIYSEKEGWCLAQDHPDTNKWFEKVQTANSETEFYLNQGGVNFGPFTLNQLLLKATSNSLIAAKGEKWVPAMEHPLTSKFFRVVKSNNQTLKKSSTSSVAIFAAIIFIGIAIAGVLWFLLEGKNDPQQPDLTLVEPSTVAESSENPRVISFDSFSLAFDQCSDAMATLNVQGNQNFSDQTFEISSQLYLSESDALGGEFTKFYQGASYPGVSSGNWWLAIRFTDSPESVRATMVTLHCDNQGNSDSEVTVNQSESWDTFENRVPLKTLSMIADLMKNEDLSLIPLVFSDELEVFHSLENISQDALETEFTNYWAKWTVVSDEIIHLSKNENAQGNTFNYERILKIHKKNQPESLLEYRIEGYLTLDEYGRVSSIKDQKNIRIN